MFVSSLFLPLCGLLWMAPAMTFGAEMEIPLVSVRRSVDMSILRRNLTDGCQYDGGTIVLGGPSSLEQDGGMYYFANRLLLAAYLMLGHINQEQCGLEIDGRNYKVDFQAYDDKSDLDVTSAIGRKLVSSPFSSSTTESTSGIDLIVAGYTSYLTAPLGAVVAEHNQQSLPHDKKLMVAGAAGVSSIFHKDPSIFGTIPPAGEYLRSVIQGLREQTSARTLATVWEDVGFPTQVCAPVPELAQEFDLELVAHVQVQVDPNTTALLPTAERLQELDPDVVISCLHECDPWMNAMRQVDWSPKAQVFLICVGADGFRQAVGTDVEYIMGVEPWHESVVATDALTGWSTQEFGARYKALSSDTTVHNLVANAAAAISIALQAMQAVGSYQNVTLLTEYMLQTTFQTIVGEVSFDEYGQNAAPTALIQYNASGQVRVTYPLDKANGPILYPMPTWDGRDCIHESDCTKTGNTCSREGVCICNTDSAEVELISVGFGSTAECVELYQTSAWDNPGVIAGVTIACVAMVAMIAAVVVLLQQKKTADTYWRVAKEELHFATPPVVVGRGSFGEVLLAEYRGTEVAVKRIVPPEQTTTKRSNAGTTSTLEMPVPGGATNNGQDLEAGNNNNNIGKSSWANMSLGGGTKSATASAIRNTITNAKEGSGGAKIDRKQLEKNLMEELSYLSKLRHPCITTVMGAVITPGEEPLMVMEYMDHGSLFDILQNNTMVFEGDTLLNILRDVSQGMRFLHASNPAVIHGDLKAANILVDKNFRAKVSDFGLSSKAEEDGKAAGTPFWMAPELLRGETVNTRSSDVYSYGVMVYEVYSRKEPYEGENPADVLSLVADRAVNKRPPVPKGCPAQIQSLLSDCLGALPDERPTFEEINTRLKRMDGKMVQADQNATRSATVSLFDIFPRHIAEALRDGREVDSEHKDCVTIFFSDIIGFTTISCKLPPKKVANLLDRLYTKLDALSNKFDIFKVETIGDAYMAVTNLVKNQESDHVARMANFSAGAIAAANSTLIDKDDPSQGYVHIRVGFHSGSVVADVVGTRNPRYCLFGDTVNTANRMESTSVANKIHCSERSAKLLRKQDSSAKLICRGNVDIKGKGKMLTFWVDTKSVSQRAFAIPESPPDDGDFSKFAGDREEQHPQNSAEESSDAFCDENIEV
ncbi:activated protein kinase catalytic subunit alpha-1 [Seminavis robusta]|uniref:Guanylate cyclase n=1 Tax=Seminavis robusta TaxID=568900 RepID=A0A9N8EWP8_9STRA|nr:activated protein kinase catalytic subunit alpha-1 [Seminavis robusta]|eukprot:Sro1777_g296930.1 activated protein kinase catalytic subunit alpha-1 (1161) ;mRNA; r:9037-13499